MAGPGRPPLAQGNRPFVTRRLRGWPTGKAAAPSTFPTRAALGQDAGRRSVQRGQNGRSLKQVDSSIRSAFKRRGIVAEQLSAPPHAGFALGL